MGISDWSSDVCSSDRVRGFVIGDPWQEKTHLGPIISPRQLARIDSMVQAAIESGARVVTGGSIIDGPGNFFAPTILTDVQNSSELVQEEIFGPVHVVLHFDEEEGAIRMTHDSAFRILVAVFTRDLDRGLSLHGSSDERLEGER